MKATDSLKAEHEGIKLMLSVMEKIAVDIKSGKSPDVGHLEKIIDFIKVFADKCHHGKEEDILFPELQKAGMSKEHGPIGVMLHEHELGRNFIRGLISATEKFKKGDSSAKTHITENLIGYTTLLRNHIEKENNILFAMADQMLNAATQDILYESFEKIEVERIGLGKHEEYHGLLKELKKIYL